MTTFAVLGAGMMGSALCVPLIDRGHRVHLVGSHLDGAIIEELARSRRHPKLDWVLPKGILAHPLQELEEVLSLSDEVVLGVASAGIPWAAEQLKGRLRPEQGVLMVSKGLSAGPSGLSVPSDTFDQALAAARNFPSVAITGPCIAGELCRRVPTCVVFSSRDPRASAHFQALLRTDNYRPELGQDALSEQACAALKNAYAMGMAFAAGLHEKSGQPPGSVALHNLEAAIFSQSVLEMQRLASWLGGNPALVAGLAGVGDLHVTCNGGRTGRFGKLLGKGLGREEAIRQMHGATLECLEVLEHLRGALQASPPQKQAPSQSLPLLEQLMAVALDDAPVRVELDRFFA